MAERGNHVQAMVKIFLHSFIIQEKNLAFIKKDHDF